MRSLTIPLFAGALLLPAADFTIPIEKYKLDNGMRVILSRDTAVPVVAVYIVYGVGARSEEKGRTGFAHLFEHMMFQGSANAPKGMHFSEVEAAGGVLNGSTHPDFTDYFQTLPANKLATALWLESDRMRSLNITEENLNNQKEAVKQERRLSFDNRPYNTAIVDLWPQLAFRNWQNSHSLIGSFEDLEAASVEDVARFFKTYYAPNNAVLSIAGDIDIASTKKLVAAYFADIPPQPQPKHPDLTEPPGFQARSEVHKDTHARVPGVIAGYPGPARRSADYYALNVLDALLTAGDSSRFQQNLVKGKQSVIQYESNLGWPFAGPSDYKDPGLWAMFLLYNPSFTGKQVVEQAQEEIAKVQRDGVEAAELDRVKAFIRAHRIRELQGVMARARLLAQYELLDGDAGWLNREMDEFLAVTPARVQAVAKKYLTPERRVVLDIVPAPAAQADTEAR